MIPWRDHRGNSCPTHPQAKVRVRYRSGHVSKDEYLAGRLRWTDLREPFDIAAYQITSLPEEARG